METQTAYTLVDVTKRLPEKNGRYLIIDNGEGESLFINGKWKSIEKPMVVEDDFCVCRFRQDILPTHWLEKQTEVYLFTKEQLDKIRGDAFEAGESFGLLPYGCSLNKSQYLKGTTE